MTLHIPVRELVLFFAALVAPSISVACDFDLLPGDEFTFPIKSPDLRRYGYSAWVAETTSAIPASLPYEKYAGRVGKLLPELVIDPLTKSNFQTAILQNCDRVYMRVPSSASFHSVIFRRDIASAERLVGRPIWVTNANVTLNQPLSTSDPAVSFPLEHGEELKVVGLELQEYGHTRGAGPFYLLVEKATGQRGLLKYNARYFTFSRPSK